MIDVEQDALGSLEQDALACAALAIEQSKTASANWRIRGAISASWALSSLPVTSAMPRPRRSALWWASSRSILAPRLVRSAEVGDPDRAPADLVLIGRADAAAGGADLAGAGRILANESSSRWSGRMSGIVGDPQIVAGDRDALAADGFDLLDQRPGIDDDAIADDASLPGRTMPEGSSDSL